MKIYCKSCGAPTDYTVEKPNFCQKCGISFETNLASTNSPPAPASFGRSKNLVEEVIGSTLSMQGLEVDYDRRDWLVQSVKLGEAVGTRTPEKNKERTSKPKGRKPSKKKVQEDFQKEAGTLRNK